MGGFLNCRTVRRGTRWAVASALVLAMMQAAEPAAAQSTDVDAATRAEVLDLDGQRARAFVDDDAVFFDRITAADYTHVETTGVTRNKTEFMELVRSGEVRFLSFDIYENKARLYGDVVILTGAYTNQIETAAGVQPVKRARHQRVYVRRDGVWQVVAHQAIEIQGANP